jgi:hypothetical protein
MPVCLPALTECLQRNVPVTRTRERNKNKARTNKQTVVAAAAASQQANRQTGKV